MFCDVLRSQDVLHVRIRLGAYPFIPLLNYTKNIQECSLLLCRLAPPAADFLFIQLLEDITRAPSQHSAMNFPAAGQLSSVQPLGLQGWSSAFASHPGTRNLNGLVEKSKKIIENQ